MSSVRFDGGNNEPESEVREMSSDVSKPTKRQRWATRRVPAAGGVRKRLSIMDRIHRRPTTKSEKFRSGASSSQPPDGQGTEDRPESGTSRKVYFNIPIPETERDEEGHLLVEYPRNKIRTAKYTPLTFVPMNIWFQFHNIANIYFLFVIILNVCFLPLDLGMLAN